MGLNNNLNIPAFITKELLTNYLAHQCSKEETDLVDKWYNSYEILPEDINESVAKYKALQQLHFKKITERIKKKKNRLKAP